MNLSPDELWAILPATLEGLARSSFNLGNLMHPMEADTVDGAAVIALHGPIFSRSTWLKFASLVNDMASAPEVKAILLDIDTPGGVVAGLTEAAAAVMEARNKKPIMAFSGGMMASAGYWIASQASRITITETAQVGSIGVVSTFIDWSKFDEKVGIKEINIISSQSPLKNLPPTEKKGLQLEQTRVDELAQVFINAVAQGRGIGAGTVAKRYGQGGLMVGESAMVAGLVDTIGFRNSVLEGSI